MAGLRRDPLGVPCAERIKLEKEEAGYALKVGAGYTVYDHPYSGVETTLKGLDGCIPSRVYPSTCVVEALKSKLQAAQLKLVHQTEEIKTLRTVVDGLQKDLRTVIREERALATTREKTLRVEHEKEITVLKRKLNLLRRDRKARRALACQEVGICTSRELLKHEMILDKKIRKRVDHARLSIHAADSGRCTDLETRFPNLWLYEAESTHI